MSKKNIRFGILLDTSIPHKIIDQMNVNKEDSQDLKQASKNACLTTEDPEFKIVMEAAKNISDRYRNALQELAK